MNSREPDYACESITAAAEWATTQTVCDLAGDEGGPDQAPGDPTFGGDAASDADAPAGGVPIHEPAMAPELLAWSNVRRGAKCLDLTTGTGGHALALAAEAGREGFLLGIDRDGGALAVAGRRLTAQGACPFELVKGRFSDAAAIAAQAGVKAFDVIIADLGLGTHQVDAPDRGFSFMTEGRLDMRFGVDEAGTPSAADVIATASEEELSDIFRRFGEERFHRAVARAICQARRAAPITTTTQLSDIVKRVVGARTQGRRLRIHPASRVMMALRIYVNGELDELEGLLHAVPGLLPRQARACFWCYHSLESRLVKHTWRAMKKDGLMQELKGSPIKPGEEEVRRNRRVRSVQMRVAERL